MGEEEEAEEEEEEDDYQEDDQEISKYYSATRLRIVHSTGKKNMDVEGSRPHQKTLSKGYSRRKSRKA